MDDDTSAVIARYREKLAVYRALATADPEKDDHNIGKPSTGNVPPQTQIQRATADGPSPSELTVVPSGAPSPKAALRTAENGSPPLPSTSRSGAYSAPGMDTDHITQRHCGSGCGQQASSRRPTRNTVRQSSSQESSIDEMFRSVGRYYNTSPADAMYQRGLLWQQRRDRHRDRLRRELGERAILECSFHPAMSSPPHRGVPSPRLGGSTQKHVARLQAARDRQRTAEAHARGRVLHRDLRKTTVPLPFSLGHSFGEPIPALRKPFVPNLDLRGALEQWQGCASCENDCDDNGLLPLDDSGSWLALTKSFREALWKAKASASSGPSQRTVQAESGEWDDSPPPPDFNNMLDGAAHSRRHQPLSTVMMNGDRADDSPQRLRGEGRGNPSPPLRTHPTAVMTSPPTAPLHPIVLEDGNCHDPTKAPAVAQAQLLRRQQAELDDLYKEMAEVRTALRGMTQAVLSRE